ncbi:MAG: hypothetical protein IKV20_04600, partial [Clostridia bacterium]|nr:hypothetical protein [Clostridia bacterium]
MKKIIGLVLALVLLTSVFAVLPTMAADEATITDVAVRLDQGITLVYKLSNGGYEYVPVAAKEMNKVAGPEGYTDGITSVKGYATDLLAKTDDELTVALVNAMLNYGAAAQNYFKYETDNLVGKPVTDTTALNELEVSAPVVNDGEGIYLGATLVLEGTLTLRFYFTGNDRVIECENNTPAVTNKGDVCYVDIPFMPYDIAEPITVTTGETSVTYAPINYLKAMASSDIENIPQMVASIYAYSVAARAYYIEYNCEHRGIILNTVVVPTIFTEGLAQGACPLCGDVISEKLENTKAEMNAFTSTDNEKDWFYKSVSVGDILGENNLYGEDGVDIFVEFSILLNETMDMFANDNFTLPGVWLNESLTGTKHGDGFYYLYLTQGGMPKGAFEMWNSRCNKVENGYIYGETCNGKGDDLYVGNFDGWHRIGVQMHFEAFVENGEPYYINTVSLYIDGVMVHKYMMRTDDDDKENNSVLTAIEAIVENDQIVGYKNRTDRYINIFRYTPNLKDDYAGETGYFPVADCYVTAGNGFVVTVTPVTNPEAQDFIQDGIPLSGKQYFAVKDLSDCYAGNHNYSDIATVDTPATCTTDGQKSIKCTVCGETQEGSVVVIPAAHTWGASTVDTHATCTTDGQKSIKCTVCSETKEGSIEVIPAAHTWAENATLDVAATCTTNGSESIKCTVCKATKPDSTVTIPATGHNGIEITVVPTLFSEGYEKGTCTVCGETKDGALAKTKATMNTMTTSHNASNVVKEEIPFSTILGDDKHFYEHDLLIEFSLLMNDYMKYIGETNVANISFPGVNGESAHWLFLENGGDAPKGQFDYWNSNAKEKILDTPIQLNFDGWYRFGVRYHQNTYRNGDTFTYDVTVSLYINGVKVHEFIQKTGNNKFLLYTAEVIDGEVV